MTNSTDFNLHNLFSIRLVNPTPEAIRAVQNQIGVKPSVVNEQPDLTVCYEDDINTPMSHLVMGKAGFANDKFYIVKNGGHSAFRVQFPFADLGKPCEIVCETGTTEIPLLNLIINLRMLAKGLLPIHASAFISDGIGVVVNGLPHGGKTSALFSFLAHGAQFISDDWIFVDGDDKIHGLHQPIKLSDWQLNQLPTYQPKVSRTKRWTIRSVRWFDSVIQAVTHPTSFPPAKVFYKGWKRLNNSQRHVNLLPETLFGEDLVACTGHFDVLLLTLSHESPGIAITPLAKEIAIERLLTSLQMEWMQWEQYYVQYLYAFPNQPNSLMETARDKQRELLKHILMNKYIFTVQHPHPVALDSLYEAINGQLKKIKRQHL